MASPFESSVFDDPLNFINSENFARIIPVTSLTIEENVNAVLRATIYISGLNIIIGGKIEHSVAALIIVTLASYLALRYKKKIIEGFAEKGDIVIDGQIFRGPTTANPLMNRILTEPFDRPSGANVNDPRVHNMVKDALLPGQNHNLFNNKVFIHRMMPNPNTDAIPDMTKFTNFIVTGNPTSEEVPSEWFDKTTSVAPRRGGGDQSEKRYAWNAGERITKENIANADI